MAHYPLGVLLSWGTFEFKAFKCSLATPPTISLQLAHVEIMGDRRPLNAAGGTIYQDNQAWSWDYHFMGDTDHALDSAAAEAVEAEFNDMMSVYEASATALLIVSSMDGTGAFQGEATLMTIEVLDKYFGALSVRLSFDVPGGFE